MWRIIVNRLAFGVAIVLLITIVVFGLSRAAGDPRNIYLDEYATPEAWDAWGERMGLDEPLYVQYGVWLWATLQGDFGESLFYNVPSIRLVKERVPNSLAIGRNRVRNRRPHWGPFGCDFGRKTRFVHRLRRPWFRVTWAIRPCVLDRNHDDSDLLRSIGLATVEP